MLGETLLNIHGLCIILQVIAIHNNTVCMCEKMCDYVQKTRAVHIRVVVCSV